MPIFALSSPSSLARALMPLRSGLPSIPAPSSILAASLQMSCLVSFPTSARIGSKLESSAYSHLFPARSSQTSASNGFHEISIRVLITGTMGPDTVPQEQGG